jgi:hypothetical protein
MSDTTSKSIDGIAAFINANFSSPFDKVRAVYDWEAYNIAYDVEALQKPHHYDKLEDIVPEALKTRKTICEGYSRLFVSLCKSCGIKSYQVTGFIAYPNVTDRHAWVAVCLENKWYLLDPTWGAGYIENNTFTWYYNESYFLADPSYMIATHLPRDPMWQLLDKPYNTSRFISKSQISVTEQKFAYADTIAAYEKLNSEDQNYFALKRAEWLVDKKDVASDSEINYLLIHELNAGKFSNAIAYYNHAVHLYNDFSTRLNRLHRSKEEVAYMTATQDTVYKLVIKAKAEISQIANFRDQFKNYEEISGKISSLYDLADHRKAYVEQYYNTPKIFRWIYM